MHTCRLRIGPLKTLIGAFLLGSIAQIGFAQSQTPAPGDPRDLNVVYYTADHQGTSRVATDSTGAIIDQSDLHPFAGERVLTSSSNNSYKFTGKERDAESRLENFGARYNASTMSRFISLGYTDPTGLYVCKDDPKDGSSPCSSDDDKAFETARQNDLQSKSADVVNAAKAYGDVNTANGVVVGFADPGKAGEGGHTVSHLGVDANGNLQARSDVTINSSASGMALDAEVGHEGSHVEDAQTIVQSITIDRLGNYRVSGDITQYRSEQRAYVITDAIYRLANKPFHGCRHAKCALGAGSSLRGISQRIDQILLANPQICHSADGKPLTSTNQGGSVLNITAPH